MQVEIISRTADALETICTFGKNCYSEEGIIELKDKYLTGVDPEDCYTHEEYLRFKEDRKIQMIKFVKGLIKSKHLTPIETVQINFAITGVSRALMAQITRHRIATFCIKSQRYVKESGFDFVVPDSIEGTSLIMYEDLMGKIQDVYDTLIEKGVPAEDARFVLPNACTTSIGVSFNLRSLMHFMELRLCSHAQWEIRQLAGLMRSEVVKRYPWMSEFLQPQCILNGKCSEKKPCSMLKNGGIK